MPFQRTRVARFARSGSPLNGRPLGGRYVPSLALILSVFSLLACEQHRPPSVYEFPSTYRGWLLIEYGRSNCPALSTEAGKFVFRFSDAGRICTSSYPAYGWAKDEYYLVAADARIPVSLARDDSTVQDAGLRIRGCGMAGQDTQTVGYFFVGTADDFRGAHSRLDGLLQLQEEPHTRTRPPA